MALPVWTALKISACTGSSAEVSSSDHRHESAILAFLWQHGGMDVGVAEWKGVHSLKQRVEHKENTARLRKKLRENLNIKKNQNQMEQLPWSVVFRVLLGLLSFVPASAVFEPDLNDREYNICLFFVFFPCSAKPSAFDSCFDVKQVKIKKKKRKKKRCVHITSVLAL